MHRNAALFFSVTIGVVVMFQLALAVGVAWGAYALGGASPGQRPIPLRLAAVLQAALLTTMAGVMLARAGVALPRWNPSSRWLIWVVVVVSMLSLGLNLLTLSPAERMIWAPVAFVLVISCLIVAFSPQ